MKTTRSFIVLTLGADDNEAIDSISKSNRLKNWLNPKISNFDNLKSGNLVKLYNSKAMGESKFLTSRVRKVFNRFKQAFTKAPIF